MPKVSVIIPVYNAEKHLQVCLDSVIDQTLKDIEIICVDDGSTDRSMAILHEYERSHPNVTVIEQENRGAGQARNNGLSHASGEYVQFLDADDYLAADACEVMYTKAAEHRLDMVKTMAYGFDDQTAQQMEVRLYDLKHLKKDAFNRVISFEQTPEMLAQDISVVPWNGIYRRAFLEQHQITFNSLKCVNDRSFYNHTIICAQRIMILPVRTVYHRMNVPTSLVANRAKHFECHFESYKIIENQCSKLSGKHRAIVLSAELKDIFGWYNKFKANDVYGPKITGQMVEFLRKIDLKLFERNKVKTPWKKHWDELMSAHPAEVGATSAGPKVSVIIPVYNGELYLRACLDSVVNQTLRDIEIICVDDGSTDDSLAILRAYQEKDPRIIVLSQENINAGAARNRGLAIAKGEYLSFLDADDIFEVSMLEKAYTYAQENQAQITAFGSDQYIQSDNVFKSAPWTIKKAMLPANTVFSASDIKQDRFRPFIGWAWDKLFRRDFIQDNRLTFQEQRTTNDMYFVFSALIRADRICVLDEVLVHQRRQTSGSLSVSRESSWHCFYEALQKVKAQMQEWGYWEWIEQDFVNYAAHSVLWNLNSLQEHTQRLLYAKLNDRWLFDLGITTKPRNYFYNQRDYVEIMRIASRSYEQYYEVNNESKEKEQILMDQAPKVSIIMPSLNVADYIDECIKSVMDQTLTDIEIICVDAGSTDGTVEILERYAQEDGRIQIIRADRKSYGYQMNLGIKAARGEYIGIVETDDYVKLDMYERLYAIAREHSLDLVKADFYRFTHDDAGNIELAYNQLSKDLSVYGKVLNPQEDGSLFRLIMNTWSGIYNREFLCNNNIWHNETPGASFQDNGFYFQTFALATRVYFVNTPFYMNRRDNPNSSVFNKGKVFIMNDEYTFIRAFIEAHPDMKERLMPIYCLRKYHAYKFNFKRIAEEFRVEYLLQFSKEMNEHKAEGYLQEAVFTTSEWRTVKTIVEDPMRFYYDNSRYHKALKNELNKQKKLVQQKEQALRDIQKSRSYKIGQAITFIPRKLRAVVRTFRNHGLVYTVKKIVKKLLGA